MFHKLKHKLYNLRQKRNTIIQFSPPRSGSTLVTNILKDIFPKKTILKKHSWIEEMSKCPVVVTYRHPLDCIASSIQAYELNPNNEVIQERIIGFERNGIWEILDIKNQSNVLMLRYEKFFNNFEVIYSEIENFFDIKLSVEIKSEINEKYDIKNVKNTIQKKSLSSFQEYDQSTLWHGNHISQYNGQSKYYKEFFTEEQIQYLKSIYSRYLSELHYYD